MEPDRDPDPEEVVCLEDEPKPKVKNEFVSYEQVEKPQLEIVTQLLLFGVDATVEAVKRRVWPVMTKDQEKQLRKTYATMFTPKSLNIYHMQDRHPLWTVTFVHLPLQRDI